MNFLQSGITKLFHNDFILDEDSLRRIEGILQKASKEITDEVVLTYKVEREDDRFYEVLNLDDVLSDPNVSGRKVNALYIELRSNHVFKENLFRARPVVSILFSTSIRGNMKVAESWTFYPSATKFQISHDNRTWALMLADELEPQILRTFRVKQFPRFVFWLLYIPIIVIVFKVINHFFPYKTDWLVFLPFFIVSLAALLAFWSSISTSRLFEPYKYIIESQSVFLWGDEIHENAYREKIRDNVFWVIVVGSLIGIAISVYMVVVML
jgi:hypothetical protein